MSGINGRDDEEIIASFSGNAADTKFDTIVGHIEEIVMSDRFQNLQNTFLEEHYKHFDNSDENKFEYTAIHKDYTQLVEKVLEDELLKCAPDFCMEEFQDELILRKDELDGEIFEILLTFTDFVTFKEMILDYKAMKEGRSFDLRDSISVIPLISSPSAHSHAPGILRAPSSGSGDQQAPSTSAHLPSPNSQQTGGSDSTVNLSRDLDLLIIGTGITPRSDSHH